MTEDERYWAEEADADYRFNVAIAAEIMLEFQDALVHNISCNYFTWGSREWMAEYDDGMLLIRPHADFKTIFECPVVWAFEVNL